MDRSRSNTPPRIVSAVAALLVSSAAAPAQLAAGHSHADELAPCNIRLPDGRGTHAYNTWPEGVIPYAFDSDIGDQNRARAEAAMAEVESVCAIDFVPRSNQPDYIFITNDSGNSSWVGKQGGAQEVSVVSWSSRFVICHELMHAAGLWHEQQRSDRNTYVRINWENIIPGFEHNFEIPSSNAKAHGPYDFDSVMHYGQFAFSDNDLPTITVRPPNQEWQDRIGQRDHLSDGDANVLVHLYGNWGVESKLTPAGGAEGDGFGTALALGRDTAIIGAVNDSQTIYRQGAAYVFERSGRAWTEAGLLTASDAGPSDAFGCAVGIYGDTALIGARGDDDRGYEAGAAYLFERLGGAWTQSAKLTAGDGASDHRFGSALSLRDGVAVIGAPGSAPAGAAYVFQRIDGAWSEVAKLTPPDPARNTAFGAAVAGDPDSVIVGSGAIDDQGIESGAAYLFERRQGTWTLAAELFPDDRTSDDGFGASVALDGSRALIGAPTHTHDSFWAGSAYVFDRVEGLWTQTAELRHQFPADEDGFGGSVALDGDTALIGARWEDVYRGAGYVFEAIDGQWVQVARLIAPDGAPLAEFGGSVSLDDGQAMIGAPKDDALGDSSGAVYLCARAGFDPDACRADLNGDGLVDTRDVIAFINAWAQQQSEADWDENGVVDSRDVVRYLNDWVSGC